MASTRLELEEMEMELQEMEMEEVVVEEHRMSRSLSTRLLVGLFDCTEISLRSQRL